MNKNTPLSFFMIVPIFTFILFSFGCSKDEKIEMPTRPAPVPVPVTNPPSGTTGSAKFLALGDSYTIGQSVQSYERFPAQTAEFLKIGGIAISNPQYIATTGWNTSNLMYAINSQPLSTDYDVVTLLIGVNDQYQHHDTVGYAGKFEALLLKSIVLAGGRKDHVFVLSIPDYSATPFVDPSKKAFVRMQIDQFNAINKEITLRHNVSYTDITPSTRQAANDLSLLAFDELHPSGKEYKKWSEMLAPLIKAVLQ